MQENHCGPLIRQIHTTLEKQLNNSMRADDLTHAQVCLIFYLIDQADGCYSMKALEKQLGLAQSTTAGIVKRTEEKGLVECLPDPDDRRSKLVRVTPEGRFRFQETMAKIERNEAWLLHALTPEERPQFISMLRRVYDSISAGGPPDEDAARKEGL